MATNITYHPSLTPPQRTTLRHQTGLTIWLTGLSASGKSTIAVALETALLSPPYNLHAYRLDGDNIRFGLNADLGFSPRDRAENIRRIAEVARLFADSCSVAVASFISPYREDRRLARRLHEEGRAGAGKDAGQKNSKTTAGGKGGEDEGVPFVEVWVDVSVEEAERRDPKGLYRRARAGEIKEFTGVSAPYETPERAEVHIRGGETSVDDAVKQILGYLEGKGYVKKGTRQGS